MHARNDFCEDKSLATNATHTIASTKSRACLIVHRIIALPHCEHILQVRPVSKKLPSQLKDDKNSLVNQSLSSEGQDASKSGNMSRRGNEAVLDDSSYGNKDAVATLPIYVQILLHLWHIGKINDTKEPILKSTWCL
jgi:hypothetical protein